MALPPSDPPPPPASTETRGAVTIHQVAALAGVSLMTVSRALNEPHRVAGPTLERVRAAIHRTGYVPNLAAGGLRSLKSRLVVALIPTTTGQLFAGMIGALSEALRERGIQLMIGESGYGAHREDDLLRAAIGRRPEGIFLTGVMHSEEGRRALQSCGIPIVETWDETEAPLDMLVGVSQVQLGSEVCRYLHGKGHRHLALISGDDPRAARRREGFLQTAAMLGLPPPVTHMLTAPTTHAQGRQAIDSLLRQAPPRIDAVFCSSDMLALGVLTQCRVMGVAVPGDLAVVGFGDLDFASSVVPALTTVRIDGDAIGRIAAAMLATRAEGLPVAKRRVEVGFTVVSRETA
ncbi:LacI family DNA-binding transcriptional regulator [Ideonella azotifigens]|uniref:LacI family DNA-binding transcriptional regulator n=1 Tax=Ideonella azotifigens TaxID=513160 RepID=A0ABN1JK77_9BURK|nr:LacI family DNA-binding transcriptional regulator [Ideonella azotifigens]MCD2341902.1 LacI family DNA-binding transcriptional regulator [Ideonella azotifigens]